MPASPIRIVVVDDNTLFRESLAAALDMQKDFNVVGHCGLRTDAKRMLAASPADVVLLDVFLPEHGSLDLLREMPNVSPGAKAVATGETESDEMVIEAMRLGARGFLVKDSSPELFFKCVRKVHLGEIWLNSRLTEALMSAFGTYQAAAPEPSKTELSRREMEVIGLVVQGYKNKDIAQALFISEKTVKNHLSAIFNKLGVSDRLELTLYAFEKRLFPTSTG